MVDRLLGRTEINEAFRRLAERLSRRHLIGDVCVYGGAAMILAFDARLATRDVDAVFAPHGPVIDEARAVARELGLPPSWLNDQVSVYVSRVADEGQTSVYDHPNLRVRRASARHLLAMKARAARAFTADQEDLVVLIRDLGLTTPAEVERICLEVFPDEPLSDRSRLAVEDAIAAARGAGGD